MKTYLVLTSLLLLVSCSKTNRAFEEFEFGKQAYIKLIVTNCESPTIIEIYSRHIFPFQEFKYQQKITQDTSFVISLPSNIYDLSYINIKEIYLLNNYTIPGDTLIAKLNLDSTLVGYDKISYEGSSAEICNYLIEKTKNKVKTGSYDYYYDSTIFISDFAKKLDRNQTIDMEFFNDYCQKNNLPEWFAKRERNNIIYKIASQKLGRVRSHWLFFDSTFVPPKDYYSFLDSIQINNPEAGLSSSYYSFLYSYFMRYIKPRNPDAIDPVNSYNTLMYEINESGIALDPRINDILIGNFITGYLTARNLTFSNIEKIDSLFEIAFPEMNEPRLRDIVSNYRDIQFQKLQEKTPLDFGDTAPGFYLSDTSGQMFRLEDFKGKVVYINFWTTYCAPCISSIPDKNKLVEDFSEDPFILINICLDEKPDKWKRIVKDHNLGGVNLICKGDWGNNLRDKYLIQTVPHYVLIDKDGLIIENNCDKPELIGNQIFGLMK